MNFDTILSEASYFAFTKIVHPDTFACGFAYFDKDKSLDVGHYIKRNASDKSLHITLRLEGNERYYIILATDDGEEFIELSNIWIPNAFIAVLECYLESSSLINSMRIFPFFRTSNEILALSMDDSDLHIGSLAITHISLLG